MILINRYLSSESFFLKNKIHIASLVKRKKLLAQQIFVLIRPFDFSLSNHHFQRAQNDNLNEPDMSFDHSFYREVHYVSIH